MSKKFNNKVLFGVLALLVLTFFVTKYFRDKRRTSPFVEKELVSIDSTAITEILLYPNSTKEEIKFVKRQESWVAESEGVVSETEDGAVERLISSLLNIKPERLVAKTKAQWEKYSLEDSMATRIIVNEEGKDKGTEIYLGKVSYRPQGFNQYSGGGAAYTYFRIGEKENVYAISGFMGFDFDKGFDNWRKKILWEVKKDQLTQLQFSYPEDSSFVLSLVDSVWMIGGERADSLFVENYLKYFEKHIEHNFADNFSANTAADYVLTVSGKDMDALVIKCWKDTDDQYVIYSSFNSGNYFYVPTKGIVEKLFVRKEDFLGKSE